MSSPLRSRLKCQTNGCKHEEYSLEEVTCSPVIAREEGGYLQVRRIEKGRRGISTSLLVLEREDGDIDRFVEHRKRGRGYLLVCWI